MNLDSLIAGALNSPLGKKAMAAAGFAEATKLRRGEALPSGPLALGVVGESSAVADALAAVGLSAEPALIDSPETRTKDDKGRDQAPAYPAKIGAVLVDASQVATVDQLEQVRAVLRPAMRGLEPSGRVIIVAADPATASSVEQAAVRQALDGIMRSVGKELRAGATANLVQVADSTTPAQLGVVLQFLLSGRSAYVDGQPLVLADVATTPAPEGRIVVVTGAARGIGAAIARRFAADGARVVVVDVPMAGEAMAGVANELHGTALQLDITVPDGGARIAEHVAQRYGEGARIGALVHCAGILRDRMLANLDEVRWASVLQVNLAAQLRMNEVLLDPSVAGGLADGARIVAVASTSGWAGNKGQTNYAASKAGVMGMVRALAPSVAERGIVVNGVAPGFIETDMTASIPVIDREIFRRSSSLLQGGKPADVAEAIVFLADPETPMNGQVVRVCGQLIVGR
ncbi:3-oxoacyl-ACP reductase [Micropruina glycogenica]|uniref:3-oxoacyl-ACP reductase n=1 Tax=Micropruina glycogenica TaxID=75385 RepID=A0A2N9JMS3_9ACTN|nr:3-oxoacyl-ACP reductase [Micropruina glycogenica]SPD88892.1 3-oxoacyl-ACP reductase [Micropruina glycogenica]